MKHAVTLLCLFALSCLCLSAVFVAGEATASTTDGVVEFLVFSNPTCPDCKFLNEDLLPRLEKEYGAKIRYQVLDYNKFENTRKMISLESAYGRSEIKFPQAYIGTNALIGHEEVEQGLEKKVQEYLAAGGVEMPVIPAQTSSAPTIAGEPVYIAYFYGKGCRECDALSIELSYMQKYGSNIVVRKYDMSKPASAKMNEAMGEVFGVPTRERGVYPSMFVGSTYLAGDDLNRKSLQSAITKSRMSGLQKVPWENAAHLLDQAQESINKRFSTLGLPTVLAAGLVDGLNPCSFTVIIFLIAYLSFIGRRRGEVLVVGGAFTMTVFVVYTFIGFGLLSFVSAIGSTGAAGKWLAGTIAGLTAVFGIIAIADYVRSRKSGKAKSSLSLSTSMTRRIHESIKKHTKVTYLIGGAVVIGFVVTVFELGCTGQVYLPTITFVARAGSDKARAIIYLLLYNVMAVIPLVVVFMLAYFGTSSERLAQFGRKHAPGLTLVGGIAMLGLSAVLFATL